MNPYNKTTQAVFHKMFEAMEELRNVSEKKSGALGDLTEFIEQGGFKKTPSFSYKLPNYTYVDFAGTRRYNYNTGPHTRKELDAVKEKMDKFFEEQTEALRVYSEQVTPILEHNHRGADAMKTIFKSVGIPETHIVYEKPTPRSTKTQPVHRTAGYLVDISREVAPLDLIKTLTHRLESDKKSFDSWYEHAMLVAKQRMAEKDDELVKKLLTDDLELSATLMEAGINVFARLQSVPSGSKLQAVAEAIALARQTVMDNATVENPAPVDLINRLAVQGRIVQKKITYDLEN